MPTTPNVVFATDTVWLDTYTMINRGEVWHADDPIVRAHPNCFTSDPSAFARGTSATPVEHATANPGERRQVRRD